MIKSQRAYHFCKLAKDNFGLKNIQKKYEITDSFWACMYCLYVENDPIVSQYITEPLHKELYSKKAL